MFVNELFKYEKEQKLLLSDARIYFLPNSIDDINLL